MALPHRILAAIICLVCGLSGVRTFAASDYDPVDPAHVDWSNPERLEHLPADDLCNLYYLTRRAQDARHAAIVRAEIAKITALRVRSEDWGDIDQGIVQLGMPQCAVVASWGLPKERHTIQAAGVFMLQWIYDDAAHGRRLVRFETVTTGGPIRTAVTAILN